MGYSNALAAYRSWPGLPHVPHRLLVFMALLADDRADPPRFFGGTDLLVQSLGRSLPATPTDRSVVSRAVRHLIEAGAISRAVGSAPGRRAVYHLHLTVAGDVNDRLQVTSTTVAGDVNDGCTSPATQRGGELGGSGEKRRSPQVGTSPALALASVELPMSTEDERRRQLAALAAAYPAMEA